MRASRISWLLPLLATVACGGDDASGGGDAAGAGGATAGDFQVEGDVLTPADAKAKADAEINQSNADAELEKLKQEIGDA